jgi:hypothetical protein
VGKIVCGCGHGFSATGRPDESLRVVRDRDASEHDRHVWRSYQLCDIERGGMLPSAGTPESEQFHASLYASQELEGCLWECPRCGCLLDRRPGEDRWLRYRPATDDPA